MVVEHKEELRSDETTPIQTDTSSDLPDDVSEFEMLSQSKRRADLPPHWFEVHQE